MISAVSSVLAASLFAGLSVAQASNSTICASGAHVIVCRASGEKPGFGILGPVKDKILAAVPNSNANFVEYPATIQGPPYTESEPEGVGNMTQLVKGYGDACPDGKMVLMGYSQGAQVVGDVLLGNQISFFPETQGLDQKYLDQIAAVILMGDPTFVKNQPVNVGNATNVSTFPRPNNDWEQRGLVGRVQSYCDARDYFCDRGDSVEIHVSYIYEYGDRAAEYVIGKFQSNSTSPSSTMSPSGGSAVPTPTAGPTGGSAPSGAPSGTTGGGAAPTGMAGVQSANMGLVGALAVALAAGMI